MSIKDILRKYLNPSEHQVPFSCAAARGFELIDALKSKKEEKQWSGS